MINIFSCLLRDFIPRFVHPSFGLSVGHILLFYLVGSSRFFYRKYSAKFSPFFEVKSFCFLVCILLQECRKCLSINLQIYLYFSQG